ncbi:SDR family NAD(P)-dependent oxidoreductase [Stieleria sp. TO1_6]|uniref:type I polyketide synthase n=1 Tax=Stieleria tagensis TaxID=2956795 RepID=UPI00209A694E|nr:type I polyketide synthase [Stieleria tagensis]MCO8122155.1 SDR family NAD(P)-dependent oxidoreductase [Stieleria tagensis]
MTQPFHSIAIIGLGCRFPGGCNDPESYWRLLRDGRDAITITPDDRWSLEKFYSPGEAKPSKTQSQWGGYIDGIDQFDPDLFGISPREAAWMDPQQRLLLETAYRAAEDAGIAIESMAGRQVSVHVGISSFDYAVAGLSSRDRGVIGPYSNTGGSSSIAANRISYCFDLRGESVAVDTACSSSLVAAHLACQSLQNPATKLAFAGGVNALLLPDFYVAFSQLGVLSSDGRCKTFDAAANGYVRSEGAGMVLLKRLDDALADGDSIYAVIRGSALNQDGRTEGMTVPNPTAQQQLIDTALQTAGVAAKDVSYVEAHGTGTPVGDPIEASAIASRYGNQPDRELRVASVKTNLGHLEAGAGIASIIKVALAIKHRQIPAHLHLTTPHPDIPFHAFGLRVPQTTEPWDVPGQRLAGINGFGYGGANAHLILGEPDPQPTPRSDSIQLTQHQQNSDPKTLFLPLSAHSQSALAATALRWADWLENSRVSLAQAASAAGCHRSHHPWRCAISGPDRQSWVDQLRSVAHSAPSTSRVIAPSRRTGGTPSTPRVAFVLSGQGPQWWAMGRGLMQSDAVFRDAIGDCDRQFAKHVEWSLIEELGRDSATSRMNKTSIAQPSLFALQVALAAVWETKGITPSVVVGHSVGEIAAAYLSGSLSFADACRVAVHRGRTMDAASSQGAMIAAGLSNKQAIQWIQGYQDQVSIAAINGPSSVTISGCEIAIGQLQTRLDDAGIFCRRLQVEYAFHSSQMDPVRRPLLKSLNDLSPTSTTIPWVSTVTGDVFAGEQAGADYWWENVRQSVRFADAMDVLAADEIELVIEIGPHPVLAYSIDECFRRHGRSVMSVPSLHRENDDQLQMTQSLGQLYCWGYPINWALNSPAAPTRVKPPALVMEKQSLWTESYENAFARCGENHDLLLGERIDGPGLEWESRIDLRLQNALADHRVRNLCVIPAAAMLQIAAAALRQSTSNTTAAQPNVSLRQFRLHNPCLLSDGSPVRIGTRYDVDRMRVTLSSSDTDNSEWQKIATVDRSSTAAVEPSAAIDLTALRHELSEPVSAQQLYRHCEKLGLNYGPGFRGVTAGWRKPHRTVVTIKLDQQQDHPLAHSAALLDSCFHGMIVADPDFDSDVRGLYLPQQIDSMDLYGDPFDSGDGELTAQIRLLRKDDYRMIADIDVFDSKGQHRIAIRGFHSVFVSGTRASDSIDDLLYRSVWQPAESKRSETESLGPRKWLVFCDQSGFGTNVVDRLPVSDQVITVLHGPCFKRLRNDGFVIDPENRDEFQRLLQDVGDGVTDLVYLWGLDAPDNEELCQDVLTKSSVLTTVAPIHLAQAWQIAVDVKQQSTAARLSIVTKAAQPPDQTSSPISMATAPLIGLGRVLVSECNRLKTKLVDITTADDHGRDDLLGELIDLRDDEDEIMYRDSIRWVRRFVPSSGLPLDHDSRLRSPNILNRGESASIEQLQYQSAPRCPLATGEIEIQTVATGLNFSDVMKSLDLYPGLPDGPVLMGAECSGRVTRVGPGVTEFRVGEAVVAIAPGSFASHVVVDTALVAPKPKSLTFAQAATLPIAFLTADYALNDCARIRSGERVLIHAASGGVGIAATQMALRAGAIVFATAGTESKRKYVRQSGASLVMDSRSLEFAQQTLQETDGEGVDVILNSLPGEAITKGLGILKTGGRFLEIGKRDIYADAALGLEPFKNNLALFAIDLDQLFREQPQRMGEKLRQLVADVECGKLNALPVEEFDADQTREAFRFMQQSKQIGKVAVEYSTGPADVYLGTFGPLELKPDRSYWVAGGLGGFGMRVVDWLIQCGARHLVVGGRSHDVPAETAEELQRWRDDEIDIRVMPMDLTSYDSVSQVAKQIEAECPPLAGVFHTAMILQDRMLADLDRETLERVLQPKVQGGWNLHAATCDCDLDQFVLFSSLSSVFGHAGQANYAAANAFLDSLAHYRRSLGMRGTVINWGHVGEVGYLAARSELSERLERQGVLAFTSDQAMRCLEHAIQTDTVQQSVLRMDWTVWRGLGISGDVSPRFAHLLRGTSDESKTRQRLATAAEVRSARHDQRPELIDEIVVSKAALLLGIDPDTIDRDRALLSMGLDSLMAVELRNWIESHLEIELPIADLMRSEGLDQVCKNIAATVDASSTAVDTGSPEELLDQLSELSDSQVDALLAEMLPSSDSERSSG